MCMCGLCRQSLTVEGAEVVLLKVVVTLVAPLPPVDAGTHSMLSQVLLSLLILCVRVCVAEPAADAAPAPATPVIASGVCPGVRPLGPTPPIHVCVCVCSVAVGPAAHCAPVPPSVCELHSVLWAGARSYSGLRVCRGVLRCHHRCVRRARPGVRTKAGPCARVCFCV